MFPIVIEIPKFVRKIKISEKQRPKYFVWNGAFIKGKSKNLPVKFYRNGVIDKPTLKDLNKSLYLGHLVKKKFIGLYSDEAEIPEIIEGKLVLCEHIEKKFSTNLKEYIPIISNPKSVGLPKWYLIKGQDIYSGVLNVHQRGTVMNKIKECYTPYLKNIPVITDYPIRVIAEIHDTIQNFYDKSSETGLGQAWDVDNYTYPYMKAFPDLLQALGKIKNDDRLHITQPPIPIFVPIENHEDRKLVFRIIKDKRKVIANNEIYKSYHKKKNTYEAEDNDLVRDEPFNEILDWKESAALEIGLKNK